MEAVVRGGGKKATQSVSAPLRTRNTLSKDSAASAPAPSKTSRLKSVALSICTSFKDDDRNPDIDIENGANLSPQSQDSGSPTSEDFDMFDDQFIPDPRADMQLSKLKKEYAWCIRNVPHQERRIALLKTCIHALQRQVNPAQKQPRIKTMSASR